ncbi:MAG TPA: MlaA family lipoprotein, partial [Alphaproteobacteria bacterium]|nr:MlaA family lipoprotein [Alphaproteobacteria bacterium]
KGWYEAGRTTLGLLDERSRELETIDKLQASSIDFYASVRNLYRQDRNAKINGKGSLENLPDL